MTESEAVDLAITRIARFVLLNDTAILEALDKVGEQERARDLKERIEGLKEASEAYAKRRPGELHKA